MKRIFFLALTAGLFATPALAESWWLIIKEKGDSGRAYNWQIPTVSQQQCEIQKAKVLSNSSWSGPSPDRKRSAICLEGK